MHPLLTFATGLLAGIAGVRLLKSAKAPDGLCHATASLGEKTRDAAVSGLTAIERSSASLRGKIAPAQDAQAAKTQPASKPAKPRRARKPAPKKAAPAPETGGTEA
jgi:hypothetical protein